ncbi:hypothetical protein N665_0084s0011 [Sinapis alba]|nr:hypothetical protein N665_0084s0011 [Sinapis alba]
MSSPIRRCSSKGKTIATATDSESSGAPLVRRPRTITLRGMESLRPPTGEDLTELNDNECSVVQFSLELEDQEATVHTSPDDVEHETELRPAQMTNSGGDTDLADKDKTSVEKEIDFALPDLLPMRWTGTDFEFDEEIDPEQEQCFIVKKNQKWENHFTTRSSFKSVRRLILQTSRHAGFSFLIPASHQRPWNPPVRYACVYESWFNNCSLWWPLPEFLTTYCSRRKIALGQYTANGIRIMVTLTVLAAELGIKMSVRLSEDLTTPSITAKTRFFYGKMVPKYNVITEKPSKVNFWNRPYFYVKINKASYEDPSVILSGYFNANIDRLGKWAQGGSQSFQEQVEAIKTLSHQYWPDISEAPETTVETSLRTRRQRMGKLNLASIPSYANSIVECLGDEVRIREPSPERNPSPKPADETEVVIITEEPTDKHPVDPLMHSRLPEEEPQGNEFQELDPATHGDEVVEYPHIINFRYQHMMFLSSRIMRHRCTYFVRSKLKGNGCMNYTNSLRAAVIEKWLELVPS